MIAAAGLTRPHSHRRAPCHTCRVNRSAIACLVIAFGAAAACGNPVEQSSAPEPTFDASATARATKPERSPTSEAGAEETPAVDAGTSSATALAPDAVTATPSVDATMAPATIPARNRPLTFSAGPYLTMEDLQARGTGTFPSDAEFLGTRLRIDSIGVDAPIVVVISDRGFIPSVIEGFEFTEVAGIEFHDYPGHGGVPGFGNTVIGGRHRYFDDTITPGPPAVFSRLRELAAGDDIRIETSDGRTFGYRVEFNKLARGDGEWPWDVLIQNITVTTEHESITLFSGDDEGGVRVVWGRAYP